MAKGVSSSATGFGIDVTNLKDLARDLRKADPALAKAMLRRVKDAGDLVAAEAKTRADAITTGNQPASGPPHGTISSSIKVQRRGVSVSVVAGGAKAPHAAAIENNGKGHVRHPIFEVATSKGGGGRTLVSHSKKHPERVQKAGLSRAGGVTGFTDKNSPPAYLAPSLTAKEDELVEAIAKAVDDTLADLGFK